MIRLFICFSNKLITFRKMLFWEFDPSKEMGNKLDLVRASKGY